MLGELEEDGLHSLELRVLRKGVDMTTVFKYGPFLKEEGNNSCSGLNQKF